MGQKGIFFLGIEKVEKRAISEFNFKWNKKE